MTTVRLCFAQTFTKKQVIRMRVCECGGIVRQHELIQNREAWTCNCCGRREVVQRQPIDLQTSEVHNSNNLTAEVEHGRQ
jgi:ubiquitin C-terminal hydrolase